MSGPQVESPAFSPWSWLVRVTTQDWLQRWQRPPRYQPLLLVCLAFVAGIALDRWLAPRSWWPWLGLAVIDSLLWWICWKTNRLRVATVCLALLWLSLGATWEHYRWRIYPANEISLYATREDRPIYVEGIVARAPKVYFTTRNDPLITAKGDPKLISPRSRFPIEVTALREGLLWRATTGRVIVAIEADERRLQPGDRIRVAGFIQLLPPALNPHEFDYAHHARGDRELCQIRSDIPGAVEVLHAAPAWWPATWLPRLRHAGSQLLYAYLSDSEAPLASAVLLGTREALPYEQTEEFILTGTVHILSISGLHVGLLAWVLFQGLRWGWIGRGKATLLIILITSLYTIMTDSEPPATRALVLVVVMAVSYWIGQPGLAWNSLALSALIVFALNPNDLFRTGAQLSFLSMSVLTWLSGLMSGQRIVDPLDRLIERTQTWPEAILMQAVRWLVLSFGTGLAIWLITMPLVMSRFYVISWSSLVLNVVLGPISLLAMIAGFLVLATGWWFPGLGIICGAVCDWCLWLMDQIIHWTAKTPGSYSWTCGPSDWWLIGLYVLLGSAAMFRYWIKLRWWSLGLLLYVAIGIGERPLRNYLDPGPRCTFIAVGHGGAALIETTDGRVILHDCGRFGSAILGERAVEAVLRSRGHTHVDTIIISHADSDHYNAIPELLRRFRVTQILVSPLMFQQLADAQAGENHSFNLGLRVLAAKIKEFGAAVNVTTAGQVLCNDAELQIKVLHPPIKIVPSTRNPKAQDNVNSVVIEVTQGSQRILLTGDVENEGIAELLKQPRQQYQVLLAPHHGSANNKPAEMAEWARPNWVILSSSLNDYVAKTVQIYEQTGASTLHLGYSGAVRVRWHNQQLELRRWRIDPW